MKGAREALGQTGIELPVFICMAIAAVFAVISLFVGIRIDPKTIGEWQVIQYWRIEWLLGAIVMLRSLKATLIALQYRHRRDSFDDS